MITHVIWDLGDTINTPPFGGQDLKPLDQCSEIKLRQDVEDTLRKLKSQGYIQAVLSNTATTDSDGARRMLERLGIAEFFSYIYATQSELTHDKPEKPSPEAFEIVLSALKVNSNQVVMIGNSWDNDIIGANRSGIHSIWLTNSSVSARTDITTSIQSPPWIIPVWDVIDVPKALDVLQDGMRNGMGTSS